MVNCHNCKATIEPVHKSHKYPIIDGCKKCSECAIMQPLENYDKHSKTQLKRMCKTCRKLSNARYYLNSKARKSKASISSCM